MNTVLAWVLVYMTGNWLPVYSPPVATLLDCQRLQAVNNELKGGARGGTEYQSKCVQLNIVVAK